MRVLLVTSWDTPCGIAEHSAMLKEAVERADAAITVEPDWHALDPCHYAVLSVKHDSPSVHGIDLVHLNYQAGLLSRWTPEAIRAFRAASGLPVVVTYHDTGVPNSEQCQQVIDACNAAVVHEPFDDLPAEKTHYWRMGVLDHVTPLSPFHVVTKGGRPVVGTIGFPFAWKCTDALIHAATDAGWAVLLFAPGATKDQIDGWLDLSPHIFIRAQFIPRLEAVQWLGACDATAFTYVTHNTGQSGAILLGVAARKPVFALSTCRQFRALRSDPLGSVAIRWVSTFEDLTKELRALGPQREQDATTAALAEQESWTTLGQQYAQLYRSLVP